LKHLTSIIAVVGLIGGLQAGPVRANELGAALVGGIIGGVIANEAKKSKRSSGTSSATRSYNAQTQTSLNYFGFDAGVPDGVLGSRSRAAVSQFQAYVGFPITGRLTQYERDFLVSSYTRAQVGGPEVVKAMQTSPDGVRSLLATWQQERMGVRTAGSSGGYAGLPQEVSDAVDEIANSSDPSGEQLLQRSGFMQLADLNNDGRSDYILNTAVAGSSFWCGAQNCSVLVFASTAGGYVRNEFLSHDATPAMFSCAQGVCRLRDISETQLASVAVQPQPVQPMAPVQPAPQPQTQLAAVPLFSPTPQAERSLTSHCSTVGLMTNSNGGFVQLASMTDPDLALNEQFCVARTYAIGVGETKVG